MDQGFSKRRQNMYLKEGVWVAAALQPQKLAIRICVLKAPKSYIMQEFEHVLKELYNQVSVNCKL